jgi:hypothetical protein
MLIITADNPKGLAYEYATEDTAQARGWIRTIIRQGGENIAVNGKAIPAETIEFIRAI